MAKRVNTCEIVRECYDKYLASVDKEKKINDVRELLEKLCDDGLVEERLRRAKIVFNAVDKKAEVLATPCVEHGITYRSGFSDEVEKQLKEISEYAYTKIELKIRTKEDFRHDDEKRNYFLAERLRDCGFEVRSWLEKTTAGKTEWLEARKVLAENDTAEAVLEVVELINLYDC